MPAKRLTDTEVKQRLDHLQGWSLTAGKLHRAFECKDFVSAFGNMTRRARCRIHEPLRMVQCLDKVVIDLNTHSAGGISDLDFKLAAKINEIFGA